MAVAFNLSLTSSKSVGTDLWVDLGLIPTNFNYRIGTWTVTASGKNMSFELRTNIIGKSTGTVAYTTLLALCACASNKSVTQDLYKKGTMYIKTVKSTGVEHWWLHITSTVTTAKTATYKITYLQE